TIEHSTSPPPNNRHKLPNDELTRRGAGTLHFQSASSAAVGCSAGLGALLVPDRQVQEHHPEAGAGRLLHLHDPDAGPAGQPLVHGRLDLASVLDSGAGTAEESRALVRQRECEELYLHGHPPSIDAGPPPNARLSCRLTRDEP